MFMKQRNRGKNDGTRLPMTVKVWDKVLFPKFVGVEIVVDKEKYLILSEDDVLAIKG